ncbi:MAG TPA: hypothetical protein DIW17_02790 [Clostridiales bacterium]|mgnify:FL=1|jgi:chaperonin cofactor prefoldin|nr:hypothetical protein [Clostridiales bacterium]
MTISDELRSIVSIDIFKKGKKPEMFAGRPYYLDYEKTYLLVADAWKEKIGGIPQSSFLLAFYENQHDSVKEALLLRAIRPAKLPTDNDVIASMVEYYKDNLKTSGKENQLDDYTKYTFGFSGLECKVIGTFYKDTNEIVQFGGDVENFYSAHNYVVYKPTSEVLEQIVNFRDGAVVGNGSDVKIGKVRYSSSRRFQENQPDVNVYVNSQDFLGKRTALFGMTRTGKSNTVKKIIEATTDSSFQSIKLDDGTSDMISDAAENLEQFKEDGTPKYKVGQIIFDINGEYANANLQDEGTAIFEKYRILTTRYSVLEKKILKF